MDQGSRRWFVGVGLAAAGHAVLGGPGRAYADAGGENAFARLERESGGRLGVAVLDTETGQRSGYRVDERFAMCSSFKMMLVAAVLGRVDRGKDRLDRMVEIPAKPLLPNSPLTEPHAGGRMTVEALCEAAMTRSDNTAANLLLASIGGPVGFTAFARSLGDMVTRLDRTEPALNEVGPGDPRDTTSPAAAVETMRKLLLGDVLQAGSRTRLTNWMIANKTGDARLRAGISKMWRVGDKTGTNDGKAIDLAIVWPPGRAAVLIAAYLVDCPRGGDKLNKVLAEVGRLVFAPPARVAIP
jgi:beta-lactamase class A